MRGPGEGLGASEGPVWLTIFEHEASLFQTPAGGNGWEKGGLLDHSISGSVHLVLIGRRNDLGLKGGTPESGGD